MPSASSSRPRLAALLLLGAAACTGSIDGPGGNGALPPGSPPPTTPGEPGNPATGQPGNPANPSVPGGPSAPGACVAPARRIWKLTPDQYSRSVEAVLPGIAGSGDRIAASLADPGGFSNAVDALSMTGPHVTQLLKASFDFASGAAAAPEKIVPCLPAGAKDPACLRTLVTTYGARAFRRDLTDVEVSAMTGFLRQQIDGADLRTGLSQFFLYLFSSPYFLYRTELGPETASNGPVTLTAFEKASALSYFLADGPPDSELMAAARRGGLDSKEGIAGQTRRLLGSADRAPGLTKFLRESLSTQLVLASRKDAEVFPTWTEALAKELALEADNFVRHVLWQEGGKLSTLLTADFSLVNKSLATFYGLSGGGADFAKATLPAGQRAGLFTQGAWLAAKADDADTAPVRRGLFLREVLLCEKVPDPPATVNAVPPQPDGKRTQKERLASHSADASCAGCHSLMDPLGLAFERYDAIGRYRTMDVGKTIETAGQLTLASGNKSFADAVELMKALASAPEVSACFVATAFRYAHGRAADGGNGSAGACTIDRLKAAFSASGGNIIDLAVALTTDDSFFVRQ